MDTRQLFEAALMRQLTENEWVVLMEIIESHIVRTGRDPTLLLCNLMAENGEDKLRELSRDINKTLEPTVYGVAICTRCGATVHTNWLIRHRKSGCKVGIVV